MSSPPALPCHSYVPLLRLPLVPLRTASTLRRYTSLYSRLLPCLAGSCVSDYIPLIAGLIAFVATPAHPLISGCSVRSHDEFNSLLLLSASSRTPLITFWTASWCPSCKIVKPIVREAIENGVGEEQGGVGFAEVEFDAPGMGDLGMRYFVSIAYAWNKTRENAG